MLKLEKLQLDSQFTEGELRTKAGIVAHGVLDLPGLTVDQRECWDRLLALVAEREGSGLDSGDVFNLQTLAIDDGSYIPLGISVLIGPVISDLAGQFVRIPTPLMIGCYGAHLHDDGDGQIFAVVWLSEDEGLEFYTKDENVRVPLRYGTVVVFDAYMEHGVRRVGDQHIDRQDYDVGLGRFISFDFHFDLQKGSSMALAVALGIDALQLA